MKIKSSIWQSICRLFTRCTSTPRPSIDHLPPNNHLTSLDSPQTISFILKRGKEIFPESDYGYASWFRDPKSEIIYGYYVGPFSQGKSIILRFREPRTLNHEGRFQPGFDCFDSSYWLFKQMISKGYKAKMVVLQNPFFGVDYAVEVEGNIYSLTPGSSSVPYFTIKEVLSPEVIERGWKERPTYAMPLDKGPIILKWEEIGKVFLAHWIEVYFDQDFHLNVAFTTDLIPTSFPQRIMSAQTIFNFNAYELSNASTLIREGQEKKAIDSLNRRNHLHEHSYLTPKDREKRILEERHNNLITDLLPPVIIKLAPLVTRMIK